MYANYNEYSAIISIIRVHSRTFAVEFRFNQRLLKELFTFIKRTGRIFVWTSKLRI
jgi:hypothetical protein